MTKKTIVFCGGGSGGHVIPALTLIERLKNDGHIIHFIGGHHEIEANIVPDKVDYYHPIFTGKLRRYFSFKNFADVFKVFIGLLQSFFIILKIKEMNVLFSTGGFVSVPVVVAAFLLRKKIFIHEQTSRVGLANKMGSYFAKKIFISFRESEQYFPSAKTIFSGYPVRAEVLDKQLKFKKFKGIDFTHSSRPILFVTGGGNGARLLNEKVKEYREDLCEKFMIIHQVGSQFLSEYQQWEGSFYFPVDFVNEEMIDLLKVSSIILSRAGAGMVSELIAMNKRSIFVPLKIAQKNEQFFNACEAEKKLGSIVINEEDFKNVNLLELFNDFLSKDESVIEHESNYQATDFLINEILNA